MLPNIFLFIFLKHLNLTKLPFIIFLHIGDYVNSYLQTYKT